MADVIPGRLYWWADYNASYRPDPFLALSNPSENFMYFMRVKTGTVFSHDGGNRACYRWLEINLD